MICKYCGAQYTGNKCTSCGKIIPLMKRSTEIDILMGNGSAPELPKLEKTFEQGLKEGYQKGLVEGYSNGLKEGKSKEPIPPRPNIKRFIFLSVLAFALGSILSGFISGRVSYDKGTDSGIRIAKSTYEPQMEELNIQYKTDIDQAKKDAFDAGLREGLSVTLTPSDTLTVSPTMTPSHNLEKQADTSEPIMVIQLDLPYSKVKNGGTIDKVVRLIQSRLKELGYKEVGLIDGDYGDKTTDAIKKFQKNENISLDGISEKSGEVGLLTYLALFPDEKIYIANPEGEENKEQDPMPSTTPPLPEENSLEISAPTATPSLDQDKTVISGSDLQYVQSLKTDEEKEDIESNEDESRKKKENKGFIEILSSKILNPLERFFRATQSIQ